MWGTTTNYPFNFANRNGFPMIESGNIEVTDSNVIVNIPKRAFRFLSGTGVILFRLNTPIPEASITLPILFSSNDFTQALTYMGGAAVTGEQMNGTGVYMIYYAKDCNLLQLITPTQTNTTGE